MKKIIYFFAFILFVLNTLMIENCISQWKPDVRLTNYPAISYTGKSRCIAANGNVVHVVWYDRRNSANGDIYYKRSTDAGISWSADIRLTNDSASSEMPSLSVSGQFVHVVWHDHRDGNWKIYYKRSTDAGLSWGNDTRMTYDSTLSAMPSISVSGQFVHVVWYDERDGNDEIYYKRSTDVNFVPNLTNIPLKIDHSC